MLTRIINTKTFLVFFYASLFCSFASHKTCADEILKSEYYVSQNIPVEDSEGNAAGSIQLLQSEEFPNARSNKNAILRFVDVSEKIVTEEQLAAPTAQIAEAFLYGTNRPTYLVTVDLECGMGSYCGPETMLIEIKHGKFVHTQPVEGKNGKRDRLWLGQSLKNAWKLVPSINGQGQEIEQIQSYQNFKSSQSDFVIAYSSYRYEHGNWHRYTRKKTGFWENEGEWPERSEFP